MSFSGQASEARLDLTAVRSWLDLLHGTSPGLISIVSTADWRGMFFDLSTQADEAAEYVRRLDGAKVQGIYLRTATLAQAPADSRSRGEDGDSLALPGFAGDIDIAGPGHKTKHLLPPDIPTAQSIVEASGLPAPTLWVASGGGVYPWWLLEQPWDLSDPGDRSNAQLTADMIQKTLKRSAAALGWHYGGEVGDLSRVLRIPGTVNRKADLERQCEVLQPASYDFFNFYQLADLARKALAAFPDDKPEVVREPVRLDSPVGERKVGDDFDMRTDWADILIPNGFEYVCHRGPARMWLRSGSESGARWSASTGKANDRDRLYLFTSAVPGLDPNTPYTKFAAYTFFEHGGDFRAATKALAGRGFGSPLAKQAATNMQVDIFPDKPPLPAPVLSEPVAPAIKGVIATGAPAYRWAPEDLSDSGVAEHAYEVAGQDFRFNVERKAWHAFNGECWGQDATFAVDRAVKSAAKKIIGYGKSLAAEDAAESKRIVKFGTSYLGDAKIKATLSQMMTLDGVAVRDKTFDAAKHLVTVGNGVLNLNTGKLGPFDRQLLLTRQMPVDFNPDAKAPWFEKFMADLLPDADLRGYVQRAMGYTLAGKVDHRAIFLLHGPPKTGKSQFLKLMEMMFGTFGTTAASDTLRVSQNGQTNNLHGLKGKRFVSTSETSVDTRLDEELIKRLTGGDGIVSRDLYEKNQQWQPECTIFMATNALPKLSVDDSAIWTRVKPIPFMTQFSKGGANKEIHNIAEMLFADEASGILNWILAGLKAFRADGLDEPAAVAASIEEHKRDSDAVATFLTDALDESILVEDTASRISSAQLFRIYQEWSARQGIRRPVGMRTFGMRMKAIGEASGKHQRVKNSVYEWTGLKPGSASGFLGTMG